MPQVVAVPSSALHDHASDLAEVYRAVFCGPPWNEPPEEIDDFLARVGQDVARPGFAATLAWDGATLVGFCYGHATTRPFPDAGDHGRVRRILGPGVDRLDDTFEVVELAVTPAARGAGVGRALLAATVADQRAWLVTGEEIGLAVTFYRRLGWHEVGSHGGTVLFANHAMPAP